MSRSLPDIWAGERAFQTDQVGSVVFVFSCRWEGKLSSVSLGIKYAWDKTRTSVHQVLVSFMTLRKREAWGTFNLIMSVAWIQCLWRADRPQAVLVLPVKGQLRQPPGSCSVVWRTVLLCLMGLKFGRESATELLGYDSITCQILDTTRRWACHPFIIWQGQKISFLVKRESILYT